MVSESGGLRSKIIAAWTEKNRLQTSMPSFPVSFDANQSNSSNRAPTLARSVSLCMGPQVASKCFLCGTKHSGKILS